MPRIAAGLPSWNGLLERLERRAGVPTEDLLPLDRGELLRRELGGSVGDEVVAELGRADRYAVTHATLAALGCTEVVTTNYDALYELAAADAYQRPVTVLPGGAVEPGTPWVLKMHGDVARPESIVLSRSDVVTYDALSRPVSSAVQALMLTRHLLVVGASMTDDNFLRLAHEVTAFRERDPRTGDDDGAPPIGTVVTLSPKPAQERLWEGRFRYLTMSDGATGAERARHLAIFLDLVAMLATSRDRYLLDPRYEGMLTSRAERDAAATARSLAAAVDGLPREGRVAWRALREQLARLGARPADPRADVGGSGQAVPHGTSAEA
ncbi:SIR2 family NAD-dependent protein deacylase [Georgenia sp. SUBG003]|uniref:SIR2 family NAD-dependent protein deacylase n=1 Tax=Georgenia sp. SUBG003 TaxID=1497974 RepID=UPI003AB643AB